MKIAIRERALPFSHRPGCRALIPGTAHILTAYPTLLKIDERDIPLGLTGPVRDFTLTLDLERGALFVSGHASDGFYRIQVEAGRFTWLKGPRKGDTFEWDAPSRPSRSPERLSLGMTKTLEWEQVMRRFDLREIAPVLYAVAQWAPKGIPVPRLGTGRLLEGPFSASFVQAALRDLLVPTLFDDLYQGLVPDERPEGSAVGLLEGAAVAIRDSLIGWKERELSLLPHLHKDWIVGRFTGIELPNLGVLDLEWTRGRPRRAMLHVTESGPITLRFASPCRHVRVRRKEGEKGERKTQGASFLVEKGLYLLDRFET